MQIAYLSEKGSVRAAELPCPLVMLASVVTKAGNGTPPSASRRSVSEMYAQYGVDPKWIDIGKSRPQLETFELGTGRDRFRLTPKAGVAFSVLNDPGYTKRMALDVVERAAAVLRYMTVNNRPPDCSADISDEIDYSEIYKKALDATSDVKTAERTLEALERFGLFFVFNGKCYRIEEEGHTEKVWLNVAASLRDA